MAENEPPEVADESWWQSMIPIGEGWDREEFRRQALLSQKCGRFADACRLLINASRQLRFDLNFAEINTLYWSWAALISQKLEAYVLARNEEQAATNPAEIASARSFKLAISQEVHLLCSRVRRFCNVTLNSAYCVTERSKLFYYVLRGEAHAKWAMALDGLRVGNRNRTTCLVAAVKAYTEAGECVDGVSVAYLPKLIYYHSYSTFLSMDRNNVNQAYGVTVMAIEDVEFATRRGLILDEMSTKVLNLIISNKDKWKSA